MAAIAYSFTTAGGTLPKLQKKVQGQMLKVFQSNCEEYSWIKKLDDFNLNFSAREVTCPIDVVRQGGGASIAEGGYEAVPRTVAPNELTFTWVNYNDRFLMTNTAMLIDKNSRAAEIKRQIVYQTEKLGEGMANRLGYMFYGLKQGKVAVNNTTVTQAAGVYALVDAYGKTDIDNTTYLKRMFANGDRVALFSGANTLLANAIGTINAAPTTSGINITWDSGSPVAVAGTHYFVFAQSSDATSAAASTDIDIWPTGLFENTDVASLHGLSNATEPEWAVAGNNATAGSLSATMIDAAKDEIANAGGGDADLLILSQGALREHKRLYRAAVHYETPVNMRIDGGTQYEGITMKSTRKTPPSRGWLMDSSSLHRWSLVALPGEKGPEVPDYGSADKIQDRNAMVFSFDYPFQFVNTNRGNTYHWSALTEA